MSFFPESTPSGATASFLCSLLQSKILKDLFPLIVATSLLPSHWSSPVRSGCFLPVYSRSCFVSSSDFDVARSCNKHVSVFIPFKIFNCITPKKKFSFFPWLCLWAPCSFHFPHISLTIPLHFPFLATPPLPSYLIVFKKEYVNHQHKTRWWISIVFRKIIYGICFPNIPEFLIPLFFCSLCSSNTVSFLAFSSATAFASAILFACNSLP